MSLLRQFLVLGLFVLAACVAIAQSPAPAELAFRTEIHPLASQTLSDAQFLTGEAGQPVTVAGVLRIAQGTGRLPVVVLLHGSGGMAGNVDAWSNDFLRAGVSTFAIDGFTGRGIVQTNTDQTQLGRLNLVLDAYRALILLTKHPRVDPSRIVLMGFSRGGQATLYASLARFHRLWNNTEAKFAAYIPFYPDCATSYIDDTDLVDKPVHVFGGTPDDYNPIALCKAFIQRATAAGHAIALTEYPDAQHAFDNPLLPQQAIVAKAAQSVRKCRIQERAVGELINAETKQSFSYKDPCVELNPHVGFDPQASAAAHVEVKALVMALPR
jgi:dienelactone hydrolase